ncbi:hypothetical protein B7463_g7793, partial [Scytalidium lignicola]
MASPAAIAATLISDGAVSLEKTHDTNGITNGVTNGVTNGTATPSTNGVAVEEQAENVSLGKEDYDSLNNQPSYKARKLRVVTIGAGFSGLTLAHKLRYQHPEMQDIVDNVIFEARPDIGGTWLANTYPGVQCDVAAHLYAYWSKFYSSGAEIFEYIKRTVKKWDLDRDVQLNKKVIGAYWQEDRGQWKLTVEHKGAQREEYADILISGQGFLKFVSLFTFPSQRTNNFYLTLCMTRNVHADFSSSPSLWKWPDIEGLHSFKGKLVHSANWDHDFDYSNKRIALIGNGSSGIQVLPQLAKTAGTDVTSFQRGPTWVISRMSPSMLLGRNETDPNPVYTEEDKRRFRTDPKYHNKYRKELVHRINKAFRLFIRDSPENIDATKFAIKQMSEKLNYDKELCEKLIPKWELGCRRVTPGEGYLESFLLPNVHLNQIPITKITENAVHTADGQTLEVDVVACATGFDVSHCPHYPLIGRNQVSLAKKWANEPESYLSVACPDFPNYFIFTGPNAVVGHGSLVEGLGWVSEYMIKWMKKISTEDIKSVEPKQEVVNDFVTYGDKIHKTLTWTGACRSWYKKNRVDGRVTATFPGSALLFNRLISDIRGEDFHIQYRSPNRFRFMGNGFTEYELDDSNDLSCSKDLSGSHGSALKSMANPAPHCVGLGLKQNHFGIVIVIWGTMVSFLYFAFSCNRQLQVYYIDVITAAATAAAPLCSDTINTAGGGLPGGGQPPMVSAEALKEFLPTSPLSRELKSSYLQSGLRNISTWGTAGYPSDTI